MSDHDDIEPPHASSATDLVLNELQLFGYRPFDDQPDPRPLPEGKMIAGAVADIFDALVATLNDTRSGRYIGGRVGYANGPVDVAISYGETTLTSQFYQGTTQKLDSGSIGASWDFGFLKLFGEYAKSDISVDNSSLIPPLSQAFGFREPGADGWLLGLTVPVGPGLIRAAYSAVDYKNTTIPGQFFNLNDPKASKFALGYVHNLSKRTALYATVAYIDNKDGADLDMNTGVAPGFYGTGVGANNLAGFRPKSSTGYDFGIRHAF